jgi:hypothetical protein
MKFVETLKEGVILLIPYISYRTFLILSDINYQPATWAYLGKNVECQSYCQGIWMLIEANTKNGILNELINRLNSGQFFSFTIIVFFVVGLALYNNKKNNTAPNQTEIVLLGIAIVIFLVLVGNFLDRYVNYLPSVLLVNELRKLNN